MFFTIRCCHRFLLHRCLLAICLLSTLSFEAADNSCFWIIPFCVQDLYRFVLCHIFVLKRLVLKALQTEVDNRAPNPMSQSLDRFFFLISIGGSVVGLDIYSSFFCSNEGFQGETISGWI